MVEFIMYHYVRDLKNSLFPKIKGLEINEFIDQIKYLKKNYNILSIEDFYNGDYNKSQKNCVLTFDDGYFDHFEFVFEILKKNNIKGSFYPPVDIIINNKVLDVNKIHIILASANEDKIFKRITTHYEKFESKVPLNSLIQKINTTSRYDTKKITIIKRLLQKILPFEIRTKICNLLLEDFLNLSETELSNSLYMSTNHIKEMIDHGMHFGSHSKSHSFFSALQKEEQEMEIKSSIKFLKSIYRKEFLLTMCYPYGDYNKDTLNLLLKYNFKIGLTTIPRIYNESDSMLLIPRRDTNDYYPKTNFNKKKL